MIHQLNEMLMSTFFLFIFNLGTVLVICQIIGKWQPKFKKEVDMKIYYFLPPLEVTRAFWLQKWEIAFSHLWKVLNP